MYQLEPGRGIWDQLDTWQYFGLVQDSYGNCVLNDDRFWCPDGRDAMWDSYVELDLESVEKRGESNSNHVYILWQTDDNIC